MDLTRIADYVAFSGTQKPQSSVPGAEVVFVGYGIVAPEFQWDDYKGVDVKGKTIVMLVNDPPVLLSLFPGARLVFALPFRGSVLSIASKDSVLSIGSVGSLGTNAAPAAIGSSMG